ncbi:MAG TPA: PKD domain-containing protein [Thermoanaerobaculia bacterium]
MIVSLLTAPVAAETVCGTSPETQRRVEELHRRTRAALGPRVASNATGDQPPTTRFADDVLFVRADELTAPNDDPADLEGISLQITRRNATTFAVTRGALQYDQAIGPLYATFGRGVVTKELALPFAFPFGEQSYSSATLSAVRGVHFTRAVIPFTNVDAMTLALSSDPLLSPIFDYFGSLAGSPNVYVKSTSTAVTITWRRADDAPFTYDLQAVLFASGDIRFSYRTIRNIGWGGVVVKTGSSAWREQRSPIATLTDPRGEVDPLYGAEREMLDMTGVELARIDGTSLVEARIHLAKPIDRSVLREGASYLVFLGDSLHRFELFVYKDRLIYGNTVDSPAARIEGSDVVLLIPGDAVPRQGKIWVYTNAFTAADSLEAVVDLGLPGEPLETDFSKLTAIETARPLVETYRLPTVNVTGVWQRLQSDFGYRNDEIDAVAIYSDFPSDILLTPFGAFATLANPGADGISQFSSAANPRTPTLMHMNSLFAFEGEGAAQILLHELGHRWLYYFAIDEGGQESHAHNPRSYHPAQWVHTPGALLADASPMGGTAFRDNGDGTYSTAGEVRHTAYSWHELYLMGLARIAEVQPWYYLTGTSLGDEYFPPPGQTVTATRVDVNVQQIVSAMGPRHPSFDAAPKEFRVLFVVLERKPVETMPPFRRQFEETFTKATGERGRVVTALSLHAPVAAFDSSSTGTVVQFTDQSGERPLAWEWTFGDGRSSRARNPRHVYSRAGTYEVTLTVTNSRGTSTVTRVVTVSGARKRRAA